MGCLDPHFKLGDRLFHLRRCKSVVKVEADVDQYISRAEVHAKNLIAPQHALLAGKHALLPRHHLGICSFAEWLASLNMAEEPVSQAAKHLATAIKVLPASAARMTFWRNDLPL